LRPSGLFGSSERPARTSLGPPREVKTTRGNRPGRFLGTRTAFWPPSPNLARTQAGRPGSVMFGYRFSTFWSASGRQKLCLPHTGIPFALDPVDGLFRARAATPRCSGEKKKSDRLGFWGGRSLPAGNAAKGGVPATRGGLANWAAIWLPCLGLGVRHVPRPVADWRAPIRGLASHENVGGFPAGLVGGPVAPAADGPATKPATVRLGCKVCNTIGRVCAGLNRSYFGAAERPRRLCPGAGRPGRTGRRASGSLSQMVRWAVSRGAGGAPVAAAAAGHADGTRAPRPGPGRRGHGPPPPGTRHGHGGPYPRQ
jgi:hypothetical protein